jgi:predicted AAA+ superfamily ATPase
LKEKIRESLIGRKRSFELSTITFEEFINHRRDYRYRYEENIADFLAIEKRKGLQLLSEYMQFGGYPRIVRKFLGSEILRVSPYQQLFRHHDACLGFFKYPF